MRFLFLIFLISWSTGIAQVLSPVTSTPLNVDHFVGVDTYNNVYYIKDMALQKKSLTQDFVFTDFQLGPIASVDIINPLKVVVFYEDLNTVVLLDNQLNEIERINFNNLPEFINVGAATNASNNRLWIFNVESQQLELFDYRNRRKTVLSQPFPGDFKGQASNFNYCFVLTQKKLRAFNIYGSLLWEQSAEGYETVIQHDENVILTKEGSLYYSWAETGTITPLLLPEITPKELQLTQDLLYIYDGKKLHNFTITLPKK